MINISNELINYKFRFLMFFSFDKNKKFLAYARLCRNYFFANKKNKEFYFLYIKRIIINNNNFLISRLVLYFFHSFSLLSNL